MLQGLSRVLVIRRDNIGDLVCTTPLLAALRRHLPGARIEALVNDYNAPVLLRNPDADAVHAYRKAKHRGPSEGRLGVWLDTWRLISGLRASRFDLALVAASGPQPSALRFARWVRARRMLAFGRAEEGIQLPVEPPRGNEAHEVERVMRLLRPLGIETDPGPVRVFPDPALAAEIRASVPAGPGPVIALHLSARKPSQRWPAQRYAQLARRLSAEAGARMLLFWAPGAADGARYPGDDAKAAEVMAACAGLPIVACRTERLERLVAGLSAVDGVVCPDGGAMHIAAGLGTPIVCLFGDSFPARWRPWGVPHVLLQPPSRDVSDVTVEAVLQAYRDLLAGSRGPNQRIGC